MIINLIKNKILYLARCPLLYFLSVGPILRHLKIFHFITPSMTNIYINVHV